MLIKNNTTALYSVQGIALVPGQETDIQEAQQELVARDIEGVEGLEIVKERAKPGPKAHKDQDEK